jgi:hypothetical protein
VHGGGCYGPGSSACHGFTPWASPIRSEKVPDYWLSQRFKLQTSDGISAEDFERLLEDLRKRLAVHLGVIVRGHHPERAEGSQEYVVSVLVDADSEADAAELWSAEIRPQIAEIHHTRPGVTEAEDTLAVWEKLE